jgi:hypothetical protein
MTIARFAEKIIWERALPVNRPYTFLRLAKSFLGKSLERGHSQLFKVQKAAFQLHANDDICIPLYKLNCVITYLFFRQ